jgi:hexulose-6-phosphate isomerase
LANPIGIMQGRLLPPVEDRIQAFPAERWEEEFALAGELGFDCIEFIFEGEEYASHPLMNADGISRINELQKETGVSVLSVCADYFMDYPLHRGSPDEIRRRISVVNELIENCAEIGVKDIVIPCVDRSSLMTMDESEAFVKALEGCIPMAEQCNINLSLETDLPPETFIYLLKRFGSGKVTVNYDIGNSAALGYSPGEEFDAYGSYISDVHVKDRVSGGGTVPLGTGVASFGTVFRRLNDLGFPGPYILQAARGETGDEKETIKGYIEFTKGYIHREG